MPRRERDPRPPIEVFGGAPTEESVQDVAVGGDGRGSRRWGIALAAVVVAVGAVALLSDGPSDDDQSSSSSTTRSTIRRTTTTSTTPGPVGPVLPVQTGAMLVLATDVPGWTQLDLDTGAFREHPAERSGSYAGLIAVQGGVVESDDEEVRYVPLFGDGGPVSLGEGPVVIPSGRSDRVWIGQMVDDADGLGPWPVSLQLVDLRGRVLARRQLPTDQYFGATEEGPVISEGGRTFVIGAEGPRQLGVGVPLGTSGALVAIHECTDTGSCAPVLVDLETGARRVLEGLRTRVGAAGYGSFELGPEGDIVTVDYGREGQPRLAWLDASGRELARGTLDGFQSVSYQRAAFLPQGQGMLWATMDGDLVRVRPVDGRLEVDRLPVPRRQTYQQVLVVSP